MEELAKSSTLAHLPQNWDKRTVLWANQILNIQTLPSLAKGTQPKRELETFPNRNPERDYVVELNTSEFTYLS